jgi:hypothetical protein
MAPKMHGMGASPKCIEYQNLFWLILGWIPFLPVLQQNSYRTSIMRSGSNFVNNYGGRGDPPTGYLCPYSSSDIPLPHGIFTPSFHTRTTTSSCNQQADTKDYISINSGNKKVYQKQVILCDPKDANLNSKKHNPNKLLGFSASTFAELQQKKPCVNWSGKPAVCICTIHQT